MDKYIYRLLKKYYKNIIKINLFKKYIIFFSNKVYIMPRRSKSTTRQSGSAVDKEVARLLAMGDKVDRSDLLALRNKYGDEGLVTKIQNVFHERHSRIIKMAKKFADAVRTKYANSNIPYHQLLMKARLHSRKLGFSEAEFAEFQRIYEQELAGTGRANEVVLPVTNMMRVLGNITQSGRADGFKVAQGDYRNLQEILKLYQESRPLHVQVVLQSLQYTDEGERLDSVIEGASYDQHKHNPGDHVHPVVAALFIPKIPLLESHFLYSNMAGIVSKLYNREHLDTRPDYELYYNLITDPNDVVCDNRTPVGDLLARCNLQNQLWNSVRQLRNGQFFNPSLREFMTAVDVCRINKHDNPDLVYGRHDGTILKRLLAAFSFRPTVVATMPVSNIFANNPYAQNARPTVTSIPMINVRLLGFTPSQQVPLGNATQQPKYINLKQAVNQVQTFIEGNVLVNRATSLLYSREVLFFYVDRRAHILNTGMNVFNMDQLPKAVAGFERINTQTVNAPCVMKVGNDNFKLRTVICAKTTLGGDLTPVKDKLTPFDGDVQTVIGSEVVIIGCDRRAGPDTRGIGRQAIMSGLSPEAIKRKKARGKNPGIGPIGAFSKFAEISGLGGSGIGNFEGWVYDPVRRFQDKDRVLAMGEHYSNKTRVLTRGVVFMYQSDTEEVKQQFALGNSSSGTTSNTSGTGPNSYSTNPSGTGPNSYSTNPSGIGLNDPEYDLVSTGFNPPSTVTNPFGVRTTPSSTGFNPPSTVTNPFGVRTTPSSTGFNPPSTVTNPFGTGPNPSGTGPNPPLSSDDLI
jgi:hypothetical protein